MATWMQHLKHDPTDWLLERACPAIRFRLLTEVLQRPLDDPQVCRAREEALNFKPALVIARLQGETGTWFDKLLDFEAPNPSRHRGPGTINQFLALAEYGWDRGHPIIHCSGARLMRYLVEDSTADLFELKGYVRGNVEADRSIRRDLSVISAALLARAGYALEPEVQAVAGQVLDLLDAQYPENGKTPSLFDGLARKREEGPTYRRLLPQALPPEMFLYTLLAFHPLFRQDERARAIVGRVTDQLMKGDKLPLRVREAGGRLYLRLSDLPIGHRSRAWFAEGRLGFLLHDLELLARTGTLVRSAKARELLGWLLERVGQEEGFHQDAGLEKHVCPSLYHYFPLEDSWRGKHKKYTDLAFRTLLILGILDRTSPHESPGGPLAGAG